MQGHNKEGDGRRPLIVPAPSRHMLQEVNKSLSNAVRVQQQQQYHHQLSPGDAMQIKAPLPGAIDLGAKPELSKSTPNLAEKSGHGRSQSRLGYNQMAMAQIKQSLAGFQISGGDGSLVPNGFDVEVMPVNQHMLRQLTQMGCDEVVAVRALKLSGNKSVQDAVHMIQKLAQPENKNGFAKISEAELQSFGSHVIRKPSFEKKYRTDSPINTENSSVRSDSPVNMASGNVPRHLYSSEGLRYVPNQGPNTQTVHSMPYIDRQPATSPPVPPRGHHTPFMVNGGDHFQPAPPSSFSYPEGLVHLAQGPSGLMSPDHVMRRMSPVQRDAGTTGMGRPHSAQSHLSNGPTTAQRGLFNSPMVARQPPLQQSTTNTGLQPANMPRCNQPPPYNQAVPSRPQSAPLHQQPQTPYLVEQIVPQIDDHSPLSSHSSSPGLLPTDYSSPGQYPPKPVQAWNAKQPTIFMHQVKSREVQKPVLQTATAPTSPPLLGEQEMNPDLPNYVSSVQAQVNMPSNGNIGYRTAQTPNPMRTTPIDMSRYQNDLYRSPHVLAREGQLPPQGGFPMNKYPGQSPGKIQIHIQNHGTGNVKVHHTQQHAAVMASAIPRPESPNLARTYNNQSPLSVISTTSTPSTNSDLVEKPPPPYPGAKIGAGGLLHPGMTPDPTRYMQPVVEELQDDQYSVDTQSVDSVPLELGREMDDSSSDKVENETHHCTSPKPERAENAEQRDRIRQETKIKHFSSQACKFYMEQHFENVMKSYKERKNRRMQLEKEMDKIGLSEEARNEMRKMLSQKESNYIRLKRAKINKSMFCKVTTLGIGAFGEVALVYKKDTKQLLAMKTLRKSDVYQRNQVAHVKAERDILAEADNEWVVKLYYSFQDDAHLYFVMDYIPGGDMMSLLIKFGIFEEPLARFYIAELVLAIESVHKMGFIHRDIKPDNILIDRDGHIKLTDFGLCTGFRWTHSSKIYQNKGNHAKQDSMEPDESWGDIYHQLEREKLSKPLERRQLRQRSQAHSLVGTPNYIAPEVLLRHGYTACCDWWSVGVILYEMLVGQPPFWANSTGETQMKVINFENTLHIPQNANLSGSAKDLIQQLCTGPANRLGRNGAGEIKKHLFFYKIKDMENLRQQPALYKPTIRTPTDTSNFDPIDPQKLHSESAESPHPKDPLENGKHPEHAFFEFTFRRFFDDGGNAYAQGLEDLNNSESNSPVYV